MVFVCAVPCAHWCWSSARISSRIQLISLTTNLWYNKNRLKFSECLVVYSGNERIRSWWRVPFWMQLASAHLGNASPIIFILRETLLVKFLSIFIGLAGVQFLPQRAKNTPYMEVYWKPTDNNMLICNWDNFMVFNKHNTHYILHIFNNWKPRKYCTNSLRQDPVARGICRMDNIASSKYCRLTSIHSNLNVIKFWTSLLYCCFDARFACFLVGSTTQYQQYVRTQYLYAICLSVVKRGKNTLNEIGKYGSCLPTPNTILLCRIYRKTWSAVRRCKALQDLRAILLLYS